MQYLSQIRAMYWINADMIDIEMLSALILLTLCEENFSVTTGFLMQGAINLEINCLLFISLNKLLKQTIKFLVIWCSYDVPELLFRHTEAVDLEMTPIANGSVGDRKSKVRYRDMSSCFR